MKKPKDPRAQKYSGQRLDPTPQDRRLEAQNRETTIAGALGAVVKSRTGRAYRVQSDRSLRREETK